MSTNLNTDDVNHPGYVELRDKCRIIWKPITGKRNIEDKLKGFSFDYLTQLFQGKGFGRCNLRFIMDIFPVYQTQDLLLAYSGVICVLLCLLGSNMSFVVQKWHFVGVCDLLSKNGKLENIFV